MLGSHQFAPVSTVLTSGPHEMWGVSSLPKDSFLWSLVDAEDAQMCLTHQQLSMQRENKEGSWKVQRVRRGTPLPVARRSGNCLYNYLKLVLEDLTEKASLCLTHRVFFFQC